jgi:hypothetical protein
MFIGGFYGLRIDATSNLKWGLLRCERSDDHANRSDRYWSYLAFPRPPVHIGS